MQHSSTDFGRPLFLVFLSLSLADSSMLARDEFDTNVVLSVRMAKAALLPHEPIMLTVSLSNRSAVATAEIPGRWEYLTGIEFKDESTEKWNSLTRWWLPEMSLPPLPPIPLGPHRSVKAKVVLYPFDSAGELRMLPSTRYFLRATLKGRNPKDWLSSRDATVQVLEVPESERQAYDGLLKEKDLIRLVAPIRHVNDVLALPKDAEEFVARFPTSAYSVYIRFTYISYSGQGRFSTNQTSFATLYREDLLRTQPWILDFQSREE